MVTTLPWLASNCCPNPLVLPVEQLPFPDSPGVSPAAVSDPPDPTPFSLEDGVVRLRMGLAYDGTGFHGVTPQPGLRTVGGLVSDALTRILRQASPVHVVVAGRTDAGVHAWGQVLHADVRAQPGTLDLVRVRRSLDALMGDQISVRMLDVAPAGFHARFSAQWRSYRFLLLNEPAADPMLRGSTWHVADQLDVDAMVLACDPFIGEHDFTSFGRLQKGPGGRTASMRRLVLEARWLSHGQPGHPGLMRFEIRATSFCQQMVRSIVGFMVEVGRGRRHGGEVLGLLAARQRVRTPLAPPGGLVLWEVGYG